MYRLRLEDIDMATVYKRGAQWYAKFWRNGQNVRRAVGPVAALTKSQARDLMLEMIRKLTYAEIHEIATPETMSFSDFADHWLANDSPQKKSKQRDREIVGILKVEWAKRNLNQITTEMIQTYAVRRLQHRAPATVLKEMQLIKRLFRVAVAWGRLVKNPAVGIDKIKVCNERVRYLTTDEMDRLMAALKPWQLPYVLFALFTGARRGEIFKLAWTGVDYERSQITLLDRKGWGGKALTVQMNATVRDLLRSLPEPINRSQTVFEPVAPMKFRRAWERACSKAGISDFRFHDLRHQAATDLLSLGATLNDVRDFLGHKTTAMTLRYAHLVDERRVNTASLLDRLKPGTKTGTGEGEK